MELYIDREELIQGLNHVQGIVERRSTNRILSNVLLAAKENVLTLTATNTEVTYIGELAGNVVVPGAITVDGTHLFQISRSLPDSTVHLKLGKQQRMEVESGSAWFKVHGLPAEDYPPITHFDEGEGISLKSKDLRWMIERCAFAIAGEDNRYGINGAHLEVVDEGAGPKLRMVATDGHRLSYAAVDFEGDFSMPDRMLLPRKALSELKKLCDNSDTLIKISFGENGALVTLPTARFFFRLIDGEFPDYRQVVPTSFQRQARISRDVLVDALKRVGLLASDRTRPVRFAFDDSSLTVSTQNVDIGESREELPLELDGGALELGFNARYFLDVLAVIDSDQIVIELGDNLSPAIVRAPEDTESVFVIMPMRLD
jgi:DNA polymerase-3 subunit beta